MFYRPLQRLELGQGIISLKSIESRLISKETSREEPSNINFQPIKALVSALVLSGTKNL